MNNTEIRWTDLTWNPASGCQKISPGCKHCYAETIAENKRGTLAFPNGFDLQLRPHKLREPFKVKAPSMIFVNSMSDLFWEQIADAYRDEVVDVIEQTPQHQYQVLTKRHENLVRYSKRRKLPSNFWAGVTVENEEYLRKRATALLDVDAEIRFLSMEPALSHMNVAPFLEGRDNTVGGDGIQWLIYGGESGHHLTRHDVMEKRGLIQIRIGTGKWEPRPDRVDWARDVRDACQAHGSLFFFKQWGGPRSTSGGKLLDGRTWEEFPRMPAWPTARAGAEVRS